MGCTGVVKHVKLKRNDTLPKIKIAVVERNSDNPGLTTPVDLTGATATFTMVTDDDARTVKVNAETATITSDVGGLIEYAWTSSDTDTVGDYLGEFEITLGGGKITLPNDDSLEIEIVADYDNT